MTAIRSITLRCDLCSSRYDEGWPTAYEARMYAKIDKGWRRDKIGRDVCPAHPKLKGSR